MCIRDRIEGVLPNYGVGLRIEVQPRMNVRLDLGKNTVQIVCNRVAAAFLDRIANPFGQLNPLLGSHVGKLMDNPAEFFRRLEKVAVDSDLDLIDIVGIEPLNTGISWCRKM